MGADLRQIQRDVLYGKLVLTLHGAQEALAEQITTAEIREAILNGSILEDYPEHRRGPCCLIHGKTESGRDLHLVVTKERAPVRVITVYVPQPPRWVTPLQRG